MTDRRGLSMSELLAQGGRSFSFEFFPPKDEAGEEQLWQAITELEPFGPTFVSVTYGAGGGTRDRTVAITERIARETTLLPVAHLTCVGHTADELGAILDELSSAGVRHVMALRGDPPTGPGTAWTPTDGGLTYANELVALIRGRADMRIGVAAFPEGHVDAPDLESDARVLRAKYDAGAEFAVTEMVLRASDYVALVERASAAGADFPIIPGIMPILNLRSMQRMVELSRRRRRDRRYARRGDHRTPHAVRRRPGAAARGGHRDRDRALRGAARCRRARPALLHAEPVQGHAGDLREPAHHGLSRPTQEVARLTAMFTVTVTGTGTSSVAPDSAVVRLAAVARGSAVAEAYEAMSTSAASVVEVAGRHTEERRVASTGITVWPWHDHSGTHQGYEARHAFAIGCSDVATAGEMLAELAREVGDDLAIDSVGLEVTEDHGAGDKALEAAFHDARERAAALARLAGAGLGAVQTIVEGGAGPAGGGPMPKMAMMRDSGGGIAPGETSVTTSVTVVWELVF